LEPTTVYAAGFDHLDRLWAAFYIGSPALFDPRSERWRTSETAPAVICHALSIDKKGQSLWMATARGIVDYNMKTRKSTGYWAGSEFRSLWFDAEKKEIWAGSWNEGLFHLEVETGGAGYQKR
jgi:ligand-binding sensor domain-containing protein